MSFSVAAAAIIVNCELALDRGGARMRKMRGQFYTAAGKGRKEGRRRFQRYLGRNAFLGPPT